MSTPVPVSVVERLQAVRYDGTSGDWICGTWIAPPATKISEEGGVLVFEVEGVQMTVNEGDYMVRAGLSDPWGGAILPAEKFTNRYREIPE